MLGEVNLTHTTSAEQALNNVASEDLTVVQRHARKPTNDKANAYKERGHQKAKDSEGMLAPSTESMVLWPHRHVGFLQDLQYRRPAKRQLFCHLPTGLSGLIRLHHTSPQPGSDPPPLPGGETNDGDVSVTRASSCTEVNNMLGLNRPRAPEGASN